MSTTKRIISGSAASWARILVTMLTQVALVPIFLTYWDVKTYGVWIAIQALVNVLSTLDRGFNDYLQFEFLKTGAEKKREISFLLWSSLSFIFIVSFIELVIVYIISFHVNIGLFTGGDKISGINYNEEIGQSLFILWIAWTMSNIIGLLFRSLSVFGYYPRMGWWNVLLAIVGSITPIIAIVNGGGIVQASYCSLTGTFITLSIQYADIRRLLKRENIVTKDASIKYGFEKYITSLGLSGRYFLENFRQQGVRLLLAPLSGATGLAAFSTMRTGANVALQGLGTIVNPIMPELMRFLRQGEQKKTEATFDTLWLVLVAVLAPSVLILQALAPYLFNIWTKGQIIYNPYLFATLSLGVLVYAWGQPAAAVVTGNNLIKQQLFISIISSGIVTGGMFLLIPKIDILGAGMSLLMAEVTAALGFIYFGKNWLNANSLVWPSRSANLSFISITITAAGMALMIEFATYKWFFLGLTCLILLFIVRLYWKNMPLIAVDKVNGILKRIPGVKKIYRTSVIES